MVAPSLRRRSKSTIAAARLTTTLAACLILQARWQVGRNPGRPEPIVRDAAACPKRGGIARFPAFAGSRCAVLARRHPRSSQTELPPFGPPRAGRAKAMDGGVKPVTVRIENDLRSAKSISSAGGPGRFAFALLPSDGTIGLTKALASLGTDLDPPPPYQVGKSDGDPPNA